MTGGVAIGVDFTDYLSQRLPYFLAAVLGLSFLLLMVVFRSLLVPLKAVVMNLLSIGAAYGVVVAVFQWGWGGGLLDIEGAPIEPFVPMMLFAIVFGLSMDYEVFLLSRVREEWDRTGDSRTSVADGLASTARVITAAAAIMVVVFGSFIGESDRVVKLFGLGLSIAVLIDATIVRMLLVPATMELLGDRNWWIPAGSTGSCQESTSKRPPTSTPNSPSSKKRRGHQDRLTTDTLSEPAIELSTARWQHASTRRLASATAQGGKRGRWRTAGGTVRADSRPSSPSS